MVPSLVAELQFASSGCRVLCLGLEIPPVQVLASNDVKAVRPSRQEQ